MSHKQTIRKRVMTMTDEYMEQMENKRMAGSWYSETSVRRVLLNIIGDYETIISRLVGEEE